MRTAIELPVDEMVAIARRYHVTELALFGSVLRPDFRPDSDVDVLVEFVQGAPVGVLEFIRLKHELSDLIGREVDLVEKPGLHWYIRDDVLAEAQVLYAA
jgi:predicted nucleotidyltransferase